ncbi:MAG: hypothetical protein V3U16_09215 [Candidatus Neomarinimicrobiota bacterium]
MATSPPSVKWAVGSRTPPASAEATAASTALPPCHRMRIPACAVSWVPAPAMPWVPQAIALWENSPWLPLIWPIASVLMIPPSRQF